MRVCLERSTPTQVFTDDCDVSGSIGCPVTLNGEIVGVLVNAWVEDGSIYADLDVAQEVEEAIADAFAHG